MQEKSSNFFCRFAARVSEFMKVLDDISKGSYERTMVREKSRKDLASEDAEAVKRQ